MKLTTEIKEVMQKHYISNVFTALANHDDKAFWSAVHDIADLRKESPDEVLSEFYEGLNRELKRREEIE